MLWIMCTVFGVVEKNCVHMGGCFGCGCIYMMEVRMTLHGDNILGILHVGL